MITSADTESAIFSGEVIVKYKAVSLFAKLLGFRVAEITEPNWDNAENGISSIIGWQSVIAGPELVFYPVGKFVLDDDEVPDLPAPIGVSV